MADKQCKYLVDGSTSTRKRGLCKINIKEDGKMEICPYIRFCKNRMRIVSSPLYGIVGCDRQRKHEGEL